MFQTSGGDNLYGTFLAADGGNFQFSNLQLNGALINTGGNVQFVSGSKITTFTAFNAPGTQVPEPSTLAIFGVGALGLAYLRRRASAH